MNQERAPSGARIPTWTVLVIAVVALVLATVALTATLIGRPGFGMTTGGGMMTGTAAGAAGRPAVATGPGPGDRGFVAGTVSAPRLIRVIAGPGYTFGPAAITVVSGESVTFQVTSMGGLVHEFMVGPADAVAADEPGTPEVADIGMMQTKSLTYTFDGTGPYAFACHADGHYEAGMHGTITLVE